MRKLTTLLIAILLSLLIPLQGYAALARLACSMPGETPASAHQHHQHDGKQPEHQQPGKACDKCGSNCSTACSTSGMVSSEASTPGPLARFAPPPFVSKPVSNFSADKPDPPPRYFLA